MHQKTLQDLAELGYDRRASSGLGWDFFKDGIPIKADKISQETGVPITTLLEGSTNPEDVKRIQEIKEPTATIKDIEESTRATFQQYKEAGWSKKDIKSQWKAENNGAPLNPLVESILDDLFSK